MEILSAPIKDFENYICRSNGEIYSLKTKRNMKVHINDRGYHTIVLKNNGRRRCAGLHRLLGECFIDNPENKCDIDHIDRNKSNNDLSNLRWATRQENNENKGMYKTNTTGHKHIYTISSGNCKGHFRYKRKYNNKWYYKQSKDLNVCIEYKKYLEENIFI